MLGIDRFDYVVLVVASIDRACKFYQDRLGLKVQTKNDGLKYLSLGHQHILLRPLGTDEESKARNEIPGSLEIKMHTTLPLNQVEAYLNEHHIPLRYSNRHASSTGHPKTCIHINDPDGNLLVITNTL